MDLSQVPTEELRAELATRTKAKKDADKAAFIASYPCPACGGDPTSLEKELVEEFRFAPRDDEGRPMLYAPYELGTTHGVRSQITITCVNGHVTMKDEIRWFDSPLEGPPLLNS